jgi:ABC-type polysaccharide/polyol phosphate export systems, permease component
VVKGLEFLRDGAMGAMQSVVPHLVIEPTRSWVALNLRDTWSYRELLYFLTWRDVRVRYKQTALGAAWAIAQPLVSMLLFTLFFGKFAKMPSDGLPYPLFAYAALMPWTFFSNSITTSSNSLVVSSGLITKVYFPRLVLPAASVLANLVDFLCAFVLFLGLLAWYRVPLTMNVLMLPVLTLLLIGIALGVGTYLAAINVRFRDVRFIVPFLIQFWLFATPIIYPASMVPEKYRLLYFLNPLAGIIEGFRVAFLSGMNGAVFNWTAIGMAAAITIALLSVAGYEFRRMERSFADVI